MHLPPRVEVIEQKVWEIFVETLEPSQEVPRDRPLVEELGFDSLDMIELSFALEDFFGFEFGRLERLIGLDEVALAEISLGERDQASLIPGSVCRYLKHSFSPSPA